jgi:hypothetical protein
MKIKNRDSKLGNKAKTRGLNKNHYNKGYWFALANIKREGIKMPRKQVVRYNSEVSYE